MAATTSSTDSPQQVLERAGDLLGGDPVGNNVILTLLHARVARPEPGRYWIVDVDGHPAGVVFQSPLHYPAVVSPMALGAVAAAVDAIVEQGIELPGVAGDAATAAAFAGHWVERAKVGARPAQGQRIYEITAVVEPRPTSGKVRPARTADQDLLVAWFAAFQADIGDRVTDSTDVVGQRVATGQLWIWEDDGPVAMAGAFDAAADVVRVGPVYTPPDRRAHGYASALVAALSLQVLADGHRCILYTDLDNPTSNAIYRALGYRALTEVLRYRFDPTP